MEQALLIVAVAFLLLGVHSFSIYPLSLVVLRRLGVGSPDDTPSPARARVASGEGGVAIVCCAHNEEAVIDAKVANLRTLHRRGHVTEILVYADNCTDRTVERLARHSDIIRVIEGEGRQGKSAGMNQLLGHVTAPLVLFTDANVMLDERAAEVVTHRFADPRLGCLGGRLRYVNGADSPTASSSSLYWRLEEGIKALESATGSTMGADGSLFAIRRSLYRPVPPHIIDDMYTSLSILCEGYSVHSDPALKAYERTSTDTGEEFRRKIRIGCQALNCHRLLWPRLRRMSALNLYKYLSHKFLRWLTAFNLATGFALLTIWALVAEVAFVLVAEGLLAALLAASRIVRLPAISAASEALLALVGTAAGVLRSVRGEQFQTWDVAGSGR